MIKHVLIICVGNICRSPIAEALLHNLVSANYPDVSVSSAGLGALVGHPADPISQELMQLRGIDLSGHVARQLSPELVFESELILTMSTEQVKQVELRYPGACGRVHRIGKWEGYDISDPFRRPRAAFEQALILIEQGINEWYRRLWN
ncbi:MAG: low molecular weight phosphotyrosine protein phosphatase [Legionellaceae bacterium]|nr:low molecular weight phosphotyrosine protein phosphatase [Legionellaceae bacterium]